MVFLALLLAAVPAFAAVGGTVVNGTTGRPQPGAVVTLFKLTQAGPQLVQATKADANGRFAIAQETGQAPLLIETGFKGVSYNHMIPPGTPAANVAVTVFETTGNAAVAPISQHIVILEPKDQQLTVTETYFLKNDGKLTYSDPGNGTLRFFVPESGKETVRVMATSPGGMAVQREAEAAKPAGVRRLDFPIKPGGETRIDITYTLPSSDPPAFSGRMFYKSVPTRLVVPNGVTLEGEGLNSLGQEPQTQAAIYETTAAAYEVKLAGTTEQADDSGPTIRTIPPPGFDDHKFQILALTLAVLALGFALLYRRGRAAAPAGTKSRE
jgi:5-hydroxyisourate hydrolase-like protein (transthyretin family)